jgi:DNA-binding IclR family transcriptional regulator
VTLIWIQMPRVRPVPAVSRSIAILRLLSRSKRSLGVKAIADELQLVPSTCLHILRVLVEEELVKLEPGTKRYVLGNGMLRLAKSLLEDADFTQLVQPVLDRLSGEHGVTAMGVEVTPRQSALVLALSHPNQPFRLHTEVGSEFKALVSATGRLIAAHSNEGWTELQQKFEAIPWDRSPTFEQWKHEVETCRTKGWSVDRDHFIAGITVVAVPIFKTSGQLTHTLVAAGLSDQLKGQKAVKLAGMMQSEVQGLAELMH